MNKRQAFPAMNQHGAALMVSLVILVLMTLIGLAAMRTSIMENKMSANTRDRELAFQAAEIALRDAELFLTTNDMDNNGFPDVGRPEPSSNGSSGIWTMEGSIDPNTANAVPWWEEPGRNETWWEANAITYNGTIINIKSAPMYIIEYHAFVKDGDLGIGNNGSTQGRDYYRITVRGTGGSDQSKVLIQGTFARRY